MTSSPAAEAEPAPLVLVSWGPPPPSGAADQALASLDPFCLSVQAYMRFQKIDFAVNNSNDAGSSPSGELPVLFDQDDVVAGSAAVLSHLRSKGFNADFSLTEQQRADAKAYCSLVEDQLLDAQLFAWWSDNVNYNKAVQPMMAKAVPWPWGYVQPRQMRKTNEWKVAQHLYHSGRQSSLAPPPPPPAPKAAQNVLKSSYARPDPAAPAATVAGPGAAAIAASGLITGSDADQLYSMARKCYAALSAKLGQQTYFFGEHPTTLDAVVFGHLAVQYLFPLPVHKLKALISGNFILFVVQRNLHFHRVPKPRRLY